MSNKPLITVNEYLAKGKIFEIPSYQRGYVWGKSRKGNNNDTDSATFFLKSILEGYTEYNNEENSNSADIFLQGITVSEQPDKIVIIDGQQRTTMLFLIMLYLGKAKNVNIHYAVRKESNTFLNELKHKNSEELLSCCNEDDKEQFQDIYYFKKSIRIIDSKLKGVDKESFFEFINDKVRFLYIDIKETDATSIFTMMNGNKADMLPEEVIKADLLRLVSQKRSNIVESEASRWDTNMVRSKYAREWDKWLHWWDRTDVKKFYGTSNVMGLLVQTLYGGKLSYEGFKKAFFEQQNEEKVKLAKVAFEKLRKLQKKFEDVFNDCELHNKIGAVLQMQKFDKPFIQAYFVKNEIIDIDRYLKLVYLGVNHEDIVKNNKPKILEQYGTVLEVLRSNNLYIEDNVEPAFRQLLRLNVQAYTEMHQSFDFQTWKERSLEHIFPKSREKDLGLFEGDGGVHSIGNLVLLYKNDNSSFNASLFNEKKAIYFDLEKRKQFKSRNLLHTISVFAGEKWGTTEIEINKAKFISEFENHYKELLIDTDND